ncbi:MAG: IS66 family transposase [Myxococcales bacterium]
MTFEELVANFQKLSSRLEQVKHVATRASEERDEFKRERDEYRKLYELVSLELERTRRHLFGRKAEAADAAQTQLAFLLATDPSATADAALANEGASSGSSRGERPKAAPHGRNKIPDHLPTERIELVPPEVQREPEAFERIGEETRELIEWRSASHVRVIVVRPKFVRRGASTNSVLIAEPLSLPIERGLAGPGLLAWVLVSKYCDHLPLHRLEGMLERYGVPVARSTLCGWVEAMHLLAAPVVSAMWDDALTSDYIAVDATGVLVQAKERCRRGHFWVLASDNGHVLFRYTKRHTKGHVRELLGGYRGYLQADAATVYDFLYLDESCVEVGCWAHCRRRFFDALSTDRERANTALGFIAKLYQIDRDTLELGAERRTHERAARAGPVLEAFFAWLDERELEVLPESPIGKAVGYAHNQRVALQRFLDDGRLRLDNNRSERELRREAVGRKKWLFVGSDDGAKWNATFVSLIASCQQHKLEPWAYLRDLFCLIPDWPQTRLLDLAPKHWRQTSEQPEVQRRLAANKLRAISLAATHSAQATPG